MFVTGNTGKLREVREILTNGPQPIEIESHSLDCEFPFGISFEPLRENKTIIHISIYIAMFLFHIWGSGKNSARDTGHDAGNSEREM